MGLPLYTLGVRVYTAMVVLILHPLILHLYCDGCTDTASSSWKPSGSWKQFVEAIRFVEAGWCSLVNPLRIKKQDARVVPRPHRTRRCGTRYLGVRCKGLGVRETQRARVAGMYSKSGVSGSGGGVAKLPNRNLGLDSSTVLARA